MQIIPPTKLMTATSPGSRWQLQAGCLTTPLLGQTLTFTLSASPFLIIHAPNRAHPHSPAQSWAVRINHGPWQRFVAGAPAIQTPWLIVALGVNDRRYPRRQVQQAMATYFRQLATVTTSQIALMIPFTQTWAPEFRAFGQQFHWPVIETAAWSASTIDGLHPDQAGSLTLGHHFAHALQRLVQVAPN